VRSVLVFVSSFHECQVFYVLCEGKNIENSYEFIARLRYIAHLSKKRILKFFKIPGNSKIIQHFLKSPSVIFFKFLFFALNVNKNPGNYTRFVKFFCHLTFIRDFEIRFLLGCAMYVKGK